MTVQGTRSSKFANRPISVWVSSSPFLCPRSKLEKDHGDGSCRPSSNGERFQIGRCSISLSVINAIAAPSRKLTNLLCSSQRNRTRLSRLPYPPRRWWMLKRTLRASGSIGTETKRCTVVNSCLSRRCKEIRLAYRRIRECYGTSSLWHLVSSTRPILQPSIDCFVALRRPAP